MKRKLRLGILGTGVAARKLYLPAWPKLQGKVELVACANRTRKKAEDYAQQAGVSRVVDTAEQLFALPEVDAVLISLPIDQQPKYVLKALAKGKAVLSEKPVAPSVAAGKRLLKSAAKHNAPWLVGENFAFMPHVFKLQTWLERGRLGDVQLVQVTQITMMDKNNPYFHTSWRAQPKHSGSFVVDGGVHLANVVHRCFGPPTSIKALATHASPSLPPPDGAVAALQFEAGFLGTWTSHFNAHHDGPMLKVFGNKANAELFYDHVVLSDAKGRKTVFESSVDSFQAQFAHFADVVLDGIPVAVTPEEALEDLHLVATIARLPKATKPSKR